VKHTFAISGDVLREVLSGEGPAYEVFQRIYVNCHRFVVNQRMTGEWGAIIQDVARQKPPVIPLSVLPLLRLALENQDKMIETEAENFPVVLAEFDANYVTRAPAIQGSGFRSMNPEEALPLASES